MVSMHENMRVGLLSAWAVLIVGCADDCPHSCGACPPAIEVSLINPDTGREIGLDAVIPEPVIVGADGWCDTYGQCSIEATGGDPKTIYEFTITLNDKEIASVVDSAREEDPKYKCCLCGYAANQLRIDVEL